jgi:TPP-dependent pyruvate/acetoin dehydrogenase alpha subunit
MREIDEETLVGLWRRMTQIRNFEERVQREIEADTLPGYVHTYHGEEAVACGVIPLLRADDWLTSTYRNHGHAIARDVPLDAIAGELYGRATGVCSGKGGSMHVADQNRRMIGAMGIVAGGLPIAAGAALAARYRGEDGVAVTFFGDGAVHEGAFHEAVEFAALFKCGVVFVCENNLYAETTAVDYHLVAGSVCRMVEAFGIPAEKVDGMDVLAVRTAADAAIGRARAGEGPSLIEAMTYRYGGQYEGDNQRYKPPAEIEEWRAKDPLKAFRAKELLPTDTLDAIDSASRAEVDAAFTAAQAAPWPDLSLVTADVYTT